MLKNLPQDYKFSTHDSSLGLIIKVSSHLGHSRHKFEIQAKMIKSELLDKSIKKVVFDVLLDQKFPFQQPRIMCKTEFTEPSLCDCRDLFSDILKSEWKIAKKLYEIVQYIPDFVSDVLI